MTTACINPSKGRFVHPTENHGISARHAARFQAFPDHFVFEGGLMAAGRQIGNAVPVEQGQRVLSGLRDAITAFLNKGLVQTNQPLSVKNRESMTTNAGKRTR
jgi:DNA (cytosine-5)-methyltransferase 1